MSTALRRIPTAFGWFLVAFSLAWLYVSMEVAWALMNPAGGDVIWYWSAAESTSWYPFLAAGTVATLAAGAVMMAGRAPRWLGTVALLVTIGVAAGMLLLRSMEWSTDYPKPGYYICAGLSVLAVVASAAAIIATPSRRNG